MKFIFVILISVIAWLFLSSPLHAQYTADIRMGITSDGFLLVKKDDRESNVRRNAGQYVSLSLKKNIHKYIFLRYGVEFRQFNAGLEYLPVSRRPPDIFDLDFQISYLSAIIGIEDGIWVREKFSLSTQFALIPSYQVANRVTGDHHGWTLEDQDSGLISDFILGIRPGLLFHYRISPGFLMLAEVAYTFHLPSFMAGMNPYVVAHHFGFGIGLVADLEYFRKD